VYDVEIFKPKYILPFYLFTKTKTGVTNNAYFQVKQKQKTLPTLPSKFWDVTLNTHIFFLASFPCIYVQIYMILHLKVAEI